MQQVPRRSFLKSLLAGSVCLPYACTERPPSPHGVDVEARFIDAVPPERGHLMLGAVDPAEFAAAAETTVDVLVVGGGVSGLAACWKLRQAGVQRLLLVELADRLGGNAMAGQAGDLAFPWGAHYINVPPAEADCVHEVLSDLGVIRGYDAAGRPLVDPDHLLRWPAERLWADGSWVEGLDPFADAGEGEMEELRAFEDDMLRWTLHRGRDGRRAFAMPLAYSTSEARVRRLDDQTMAQYVESRGWRSRRLAWLHRSGLQGRLRQPRRRRLRLGGHPLLRLPLLRLPPAGGLPLRHPDLAPGQPVPRRRHGSRADGGGAVAGDGRAPPPRWGNDGRGPVHPRPHGGAAAGPGPVRRLRRQAAHGGAGDRGSARGPAAGHGRTGLRPLDRGRRKALRGAGRRRSGLGQRDDGQPFRRLRLRPPPGLAWPRRTGARCSSTTCPYSTIRPRPGSSC